MKFKPLIMFRTRGLSGPLFQSFSNRMIHSVGNFIGNSGPIPSPELEISTEDGSAFFITEASTSASPEYIETE